MKHTDTGLTHRRIASLVLAIAWGSTTTAQATLVVGPGGYSDLPTAYAAALPGDLILVRQPTYFVNLSGKGVRVLSDGARHRIDAMYGPLTAQIDSVPSGQRLELHGFDIVPIGLLPTNNCSAITISNNSGTVVFADCGLRADLGPQISTGPSLLVLNSANIHFVDCVLRGRNGYHFNVCTQATDAITVQNSTVGLQRTFLRGGDGAGLGPCSITSHGVGLSASNSTIACVSSSVYGGSSWGLPLDLRMSQSTVYGPGFLYVSGPSGTYYGFGGSPPVMVASSVQLVHDASYLPMLTATLSSTSLSLSIASSGTSPATIFVLGTPGVLPPPGPAFAGPLLLDVTAPTVMVPSATSNLVMPVSTAQAMALQNQTFYVTAAELSPSLVLRFASGDTVRF